LTKILETENIQLEFLVKSLCSCDLFGW